MKKAMKRYICLYVLLAAALLLTACAAQEAEAPGQETEPPVVETVAPVEISEVMASNKSTLADGSGAFPDWLELHNTGVETADLGGYWLAIGSDRWQIPALSIEPDAYALILCTDTTVGADGLYAPFGISAKGEELVLEAPGGTVADRFSVPAAQADVSVIRSAEGEILPADHATPGFENSREGFVRFQESLINTSPLQINEVMVYNEWYLPENGEYYDWVELKNMSAAALNMGGYTLTDKSGRPYPLPDVTLGPGETYVVLCTGEEPEEDEPQDGESAAQGAPFGLNAQGDMLFLTKAGILCDYMRLSGLRYGGSYGRMAGQNGFFYFDLPTPGDENTDGARLIAPKPQLMGEDGVFNDVKSVTVELSAEGAVYYTTDGSDPGPWATRYEGPVTLEKTTVIRAVNVLDGALQSDSLDLSFIINEGHTLPVVSMVTDPDNLFGGSGIYSNPIEHWERVGSLSFFEEGESFHIDCGIKLHGATSRMAQEKKSFKIQFRSRYEGELEYDLFENGVTEFSSILLRAAQEAHFSTLMRDNLMHQLAIENFPALPAQDYRYSVLYINGQYWGIYNIREAHSAAHYANHYGYDEDYVAHWQGGWDKYSSIAQIYDFILSHDLRDDENYSYVARHLDIESIIGWTIIEAYSANYDINSPNMRFYYSYEDDKTAYALVDLDLGMFKTEGLVYPLHFGYGYNDIVAALTRNEQFRTQLLTELSDALNGPMSDEAVVAKIDSLADELRPEIPRDGERWGCTLKSWERMIDDLKSWVTSFVAGGRARFLAVDADYYLKMTSEEKQAYFGDILSKPLK